MSLSNDEIDLIRESFDELLIAPDESAGIFYGALFEQDPKLRQLFVEDIENQGRKLINTLGVVVAQLDTLDAMVPVLHDLALRHVAYGVQPEDYQPVGEALAQMIAKTNTHQADPSCAAAWGKAYQHISDVMIEMAYAEDTARP